MENAEPYRRSSRSVARALSGFDFCRSGSETHLLFSVTPRRYYDLDESVLSTGSEIEEPDGSSISYDFVDLS